VIKGSPLEDQVTSVQWRENRFGHVEEDQRQASHSSDTLVYGNKAIAGLFETGVVEQEVATDADGRPSAGQQDRADPGAPGSTLTTSKRYADPWGNL